jgi:hypothetical protein
MDGTYISNVRTRKIKKYMGFDPNELTHIGVKYTGKIKQNDEVQFTIGYSIIYFVELEHYQCYFEVTPNVLDKNRVQYKGHGYEFNYLSDFDYKSLLKFIDYSLQSFNVKNCNEKTCMSSKFIGFVVYNCFLELMTKYYDEKKLKKLISQYVGI